MQTLRELQSKADADGKQVWLLAFEADGPSEMEKLMQEVAYFFSDGFYEFLDGEGTLDNILPVGDDLSLSTALNEDGEEVTVALLKAVSPQALSKSGEEYVTAVGPLPNDPLLVFTTVDAEDRDKRTLCIKLRHNSAPTAAPPQRDHIEETPLRLDALDEEILRAVDRDSRPPSEGLKLVTPTPREIESLEEPSRLPDAARDQLTDVSRTYADFDKLRASVERVSHEMIELRAALGDRSGADWIQVEALSVRVSMTVAAVMAAKQRELDMASALMERAFQYVLQRQADLLQATRIELEERSPPSEPAQPVAADDEPSASEPPPFVLDEDSFRSSVAPTSSGDKLKSVLPKRLATMLRS